MLIKEFFINLSIFAFLVSLAIFIRVFVIHKDFKSYNLVGGLYAGIIAVILMFFHFKHLGSMCDLRVVPLILSFIYFGRTAGWITLILILIMRIFYLGDNWEPSVIAFLGMTILFTIFKTYLKNLHPFKSAFLYLAGYTSLIQFVFEFLWPSATFITFDVQILLFMSFGLIIGLFLIESYYKLFRLTQNLSRMNQNLVESKQALAESKKELRDTVHEQQGGIFKFKKVNERFIFTLFDGQFFYQNGWIPEDVIEKDLQTVSPPHLFPKSLEYYQIAWKGKEVTFEIPWPDDKTIIFISLRPIKRDGKVTEVVGSIVDITERKKMEEELRATKERLESFINHNTDSISIIDLDQRVLQVNKAFEELFGWSEQEIIGQKLPTIPTSLMNESEKLYQKVISGELITGLETVRKRKDESLIDVNLTLSPIRDAKGNAVAFSAIIRDISNKKQTERELCRLHRQLQESEMKYRALFEQAADAVYLVELNEDRFPTRFIEVNPVGCERFGYSREEILLMPFADVVHQNSPMLLKIMEKIKAGERCFTLQDEYVFRSGRKMNTEFSLQVFNLGEKEVFLAISRDITERLKTEELLRKSEKLAIVGQLATAIAHEVNNPLTAMKGLVQLLKSTENEKKMFYIDVVLSEIDRIEVITNEFMAIAKPQAIKVQPNDLQMLIGKVIMLLQPRALMNNIKIRTEFKPDIPLIPCEGNQLKQVFINILKNAIEAMPMGGEIIVQLDKPDDHQVSICFIDHGYGIPKERIPYLGEPFYSIKEEGIGLGLLTCYKIVETHQGSIVIESEMGKGTTVNVFLPLYQIQNVHSFSYTEIGKEEYQLP